MKTNVGGIDRALRIVVGVVLIGLAAGAVVLRTVLRARRARHVRSEQMVANARWGNRSTSARS